MSLCWGATSRKLEFSTSFEFENEIIAFARMDGGFVVVTTEKVVQLDDTGKVHKQARYNLLSRASTFDLSAPEAEQKLTLGPHTTHGAASKPETRQTLLALVQIKFLEGAERLVIFSYKVNSRYHVAFFGFKIMALHVLCLSDSGPLAIETAPNCLFLLNSRGIFLFSPRSGIEGSLYLFRMGWVRFECVGRLLEGAVLLRARESEEAFYFMHQSEGLSCFKSTIYRFGTRRASEGHTLHVSFTLPEAVTCLDFAEGGHFFACLNKSKSISFFDSRGHPIEEFNAACAPYQILDLSFAARTSLLVLREQRSILVFETENSFCLKTRVCFELLAQAQLFKLLSATGQEVIVNTASNLCLFK